ncbi:tRNA epoxyqueuosine(34) reductase QueG [Cellvibrio polysaccharolyticus]|uniref:Epoxyqueuosine reductase n=1 Tax=Cellvibrio polysaccharolyticus TaxID=2082724 RepID=A0A928V451_9GAMM|nr:tRNA epoxyqueuosine(34) reductase QueG [Cellvibrio polysaccharolyticus]MBE8716289.1 tRNA epoxyqueuosine(34) reductase QueG [Cellvibrio polysaccharolyticus]
MPDQPDLNQLTADIKRWGRELGFQQVGITDIDLSVQEQKLQAWLEKGYHGSMEWLAAHDNKRSRPADLLPGTLRVISVRLDYLPADTEQIRILKDSNKAYISRYTLGRDYHKLIRKRLAQLAKNIDDALPDGYPGKGILQNRAFVDSAPVMERPLAEKAGLGWAGKHTLIINSKAGSWFFLGEIFTFLPLPVDVSEEVNRCGDCTACLKVCPTDAFPEPYQLDARRCISYLTIENKDAIPLEFREPIGNRIFGCDDCQAICPWNKYAQFTGEGAFQPRHGLANSDLLTLFQWTEAEFLAHTEGSAIRRIGYQQWLRNLAVGLGNAPSSDDIIAALHKKRPDCLPMVQEHIDWALAQQANPQHRRKRKIRREV